MRMALLTTVGLEIEFADVPRHLMRDVAASTGWRVVHDGSCAHHGTTIANIPVNPNTRIATTKTTFGGELVSPPFETEDDLWLDAVSRILEKLYTLGESYSNKTSIHIHVNTGSLPIFVVRNLLNAACYLEAGFYRLACADAGVHRGTSHCDYGYCRPLTGKGPPVVPDQSGAMRQIFTVDTMKNATNWKELKTAVGRYDRWEGGKYHEARYVWLNPLTWFIYGSTEFRLFNFTMRLRYIKAWVEICKELVRVSFGKYSELPQNPLGSCDLTLDDFIEFLMIDNKEVIKTLATLWDSADYQPGVSGYQRGHIGHGTNWRGTLAKLKPPIINEDIYDFHRFD